MTQDDAKEEAIHSLSAHIDQTVAVVQTAMRGHGLLTEIKRIDYVAQVIVLTFPQVQPTSDQIDVIGLSVRRTWPEMPHLTATLFKVSKMDSDLILDLNAPSGIVALAEAGNVAALAAVAAGTDALAVIESATMKQTVLRREGMMTIHESVL